MYKIPKLTTHNHSALKTQIISFVDKDENQYSSYPIPNTKHKHMLINRLL